MHTKIHQGLSVIGIGLALGCVPFAAGAASLYSVVDLGVLGNSRTGTAYGINDSGQVVGYMTNSAGNRRAFLYSNGSAQVLGTLGGALSIGYSINAAGQITGVSDTSSSSGDRHAFFYSNGQMQDLGTLGVSAPPYLQSSLGYGINDNGQIVGYSRETFGPSHAVMYSSGSWSDLGTLQGEISLSSSAIARAINDAGDVVGGSATDSNGTHAFLYSNGVMQDLGTLGGGDSTAFAINNVGQIAGSASTTSASRPFLYTDGSMLDLGTLGGLNGTAYGINDIGQVVGVADTQVQGAHAFLYSDGSMLDLNLLLAADFLADGWVIYEARDINNLGQIAAYGCRKFSTSCGAVRLDPVAAPLPAAAFFMLSAIGSLGVARWRARVTSR